MSDNREWFGVRTLYRVVPVGRPKGRDRFYSASMTLVEERVVVIKARNAKEAARIGKREAADYARDEHRNPYGQRVKTRLLGHLDVFDTNEPLRDRMEVFSSTEVIPRGVSDRAVIERPIGQPESNRTYRSRRNVLNLMFAGMVPGVKPTRKEEAFRRKFEGALARRWRRDA